MTRIVQIVVRNIKELVAREDKYLRTYLQLIVNNLSAYELDLIKKELRK